MGLEEGKAEQEIKEEYIETKFHERLDLELPNIKKVKEEVKIECKEEYIEQNVNDKVPIELETIKKEGTITRKVKDEVKIECKEEYLEQNFKIIKRETKNPEDEIKTEFIESRFHENLGFNLECLKMEPELSAVSTPAKQKNFHVIVETNLSPIKKIPNKLGTFENEPNNDFEKRIKPEPTESPATSTLAATPPPPPPNPTSSASYTSSAPPTCSPPPIAPSFSPPTSSSSSSSSAPPLPATPPTPLETVEEEAGHGKETKGNEPTHTDKVLEIRASTAEYV